MVRKPKVKPAAIVVKNNGISGTFLFWAIMIFAFFTRLLFIRQLSGSICFNPVGVDEVYYDNWGLSISEGHIIGHTAFNGWPLYAYFLGFIYALFGHSVSAVRCIQIFLGSVNCALVYLLGKRIFSRKIGLLSAFLFSMYGLFIFFDGHLLNVTLAIFLNLLAMLMLFYSFSQENKIGFFISGLIIGFSGLVMAGIMIFIPFVILGAFFFIRKISSLFVCAAFLAGALCPIFLSVAHNYLAEKDIVLMTVHSGIAFYIGNNPDAGPYFSPIKEIGGLDKEAFIQDARILAEKAMKRPLRSSEVSAYWVSRAVNFIANEPFQYAHLLSRRMLALVNKNEFYDTTISYAAMKRYAPVLGVTQLKFSMIFPFAILGMFLNLRLNKGNYLLYGYALSFVLALMLFSTISRYRLPLVPSLIIFSAQGLYKLWRAIISSHRELLYCLPILAAAALLVNIPLPEANLETYGESNFLGLGYNRSGDYDKAIESFKKGLSIAPDNAQLYNNLGQAYLYKGMFDYAELNIKKAIEIWPDFSEAHSSLGTLYKNKGLLDESLEEYRKAVALRPDSPDFHLNLGNAYARKGQFPSALEEFKKSLSFIKKPEYYDSLGVTYMKMGKRDDAIEAWEEALKIDPGFAKAKQWLSKYKQ